MDKREPANRKVIIPVLVKVLDLNDNAPKFTQPIYSVHVNELTPVDSIVLDSIQATDLDSANNGLVEYSLAGQMPATYPVTSTTPSSTPTTTTTTTTAIITTTTTNAQRLQPREMMSAYLATSQQTTIATPATGTTTPASAITSTATITPIGGYSSTNAATTLDSSSSKPSSSFASPPTDQKQQPTNRSPPTINLDSEPIINGPMEEPDDDESDEALLAAMNGNSTFGETGGQDGGDMPEATSGGSSIKVTRKKRRRRHYEVPTTMMAQAYKRRMTTIPTMPTTTIRPQQLWTNLMGMPSSDSDASLNNQLSTPQRDSNELFSLEFVHGSSKPVIRLRKPLDYETQRVHTLTIVATDRAINPRDRLSTQAKIVIRVLDGDDQGPAFILDQTGCATSSFQSTTSDPSSFQTSGPLVARRARRSVSFEDPTMTTSSGPIASSSTSSSTMTSRDQYPKHRGFKVTDENFDFSDTLGAEDEHETPMSDAPASGGSLAAIAVPPPAAETTTSSRNRRFPPTSQTMMPNQLPVTITRQQQHQVAGSAAATIKSRYMDYTCLQNTGNSQQVEYFATVMTGDTDYLLRIAPQAIKARDRDELNAPIRYSFVNGTPSNFTAYFQINPLDASIKQVAPLERQQAQEFVIWVQAQEQTVNKLSSLAKLTIEVIPTDKNPPILVPNSYSGFIEENSPIGSNVFVSPDLNLRVNSNYSNLLRISVMDGDANSPGAGQSQRAAQLYEFETTSDAFKVNRDGFFYVNKWPLDRDPPSQVVHMFQVTARQLGIASSRSISSPISINITLLDLNDNPPILANSSLLAVHLTASNERVARPVTLIKALDKDSPENARMLFSIKHVSNNGKERFRINEDTGELEALGKFVAGEQFSLTIQVADELGRSSQGIVDVLVTPGPNTGGPQFVMPNMSNNLGHTIEGRDASSPSSSAAISLQNQSQNQLRGGYQVEINEGIAPHSAVFQVLATDPENDPISYSIVDGNVNNDFYINSKSGTIYVANKLDREEVSAYSLLVQARDSGGLASARHVYIQIADNNDQNPVFSSAHYGFSVEEGVADRILGKVMAQDGDWQENGQVVYSLAAADSPQVPTSPVTGKPMFSIDDRTGEIKLLERLDYEKAKSHALIVTARDLGENPRSSTASVSIKVIDIQDEAPYFERYYYETRLVENVAQQRVAQVFAKDPDSVAQVTYVLRSGDSSLFSVDPQSGLVTTIRGLDYEESRNHLLLIGTQEQSSLDMATAAEQVASSIQSGETLDKSPICRIDVTVIDTNDNAPYFAQQPLPVRIQDSAQLGTHVTIIQASDLDAAEPNNQIRYELVSSADSDTLSALQSMTITSDECLQLFMIDASSGSINVKSDLKRDSRSECQLIIRARDLGQPSLSSSTSITIFIDHIAEISPTTMIGFADSSFTVELAENCAPNTLVKTLPIINKPKINFPLSCEIVSGNELGKFYVRESEQRDCELRVAVSGQVSGQQQQVPTVIDYEQRQKYLLTLKLNTLASNAKTIASVNVNIIDKNDNRPLFYQPARYSHLTQQKFLAAIASDSPSETQIIQLRATDSDSPHSNGLVSYELLNDNELEARFKVDPIDGIVRTSRPVEDIPHTRLPLKLRVMARDNPEIPSDSLESIAEVVVNLIDDRHRLALVLKDTPTGRALDSKEELLGAIQERTGLIPGLERAESLKVFRNGSLESDVSGTDFWFYLIEPGTFRIVSSEEPRIKSTLLDARAQSSLLDIVGQNLGKFIEL